MPREDHPALFDDLGTVFYVSKRLYSLSIVSLVVALLSLVPVYNGNKEPVALTPFVTTTAPQRTTPGQDQSNEPGKSEGQASGVKWYGDTKEPSPELAAIRQWCADKAVVDSECSFEYFTDKLTSASDPRAAIKATIAEISALKLKDDLFIPECHHAFHAVGQAAPRLIGVIESLRATPDVECQGGMVHGVVQTWSQEASDEEVERDYATLCNEYATGNVRSFCAHGIGHAIAVHFPDDVLKTTMMCDKMYEYDTAEGCVTGTVMEFGGSDFVTVAISRSLGKTRAKDSVTEEQRMTLCQSLPERLQDACSEKVFQLFRDLMPEPEKLMKLCDALNVKSSVPMRENCGYSIGEVAVSAKGLVTIMDEDAKITDYYTPCTKIPSDLADICTKGFIESLMRDVPLNNNRVYKNPCRALPVSVSKACEAANESAKGSREAA